MNDRTSLPILGIVGPLSGCGVAPSVNILGSFFPAWLMCIVAGIALAVLTHHALVATRVAPYLGPSYLVYPCLGALWICATWLLVFGS